MSNPIEELKSKVVNTLVLSNGFTLDEAYEAVDASVSSDTTEIWHADADPNELAKILASGDED